EDAEGVSLPHNDALVITLEVAGFDVKRVFIDMGSSVDIIFYDCFAQINKHLNLELKPVATELYGFNGGEVMPMGEVSLTVAMGSGNTRKVCMVRFIVVGAESSYNVILGRTGLNAFQAVVSTYHMTIKYLVGENVGEVAGDQLTSRSCYQTTVSNNKQLAKKHPIGLLQPLPIPRWKWEEVTMDFVTGLPKSSEHHDAIWVVVDRLTKVAHFLPVSMRMSLDKLAEIYTRGIIRLHGVPVTIVSDRDPRF
ncbi:Unknown protein, partial [Striga hermonthica]